MTADALLSRIADELRPLTSGLGVEVVIVVPAGGEAHGAPMVVAIGSVSAVAVGVADVLRPVLASGAPQLVLVHNHPDGRTASPADHAFTRRLVASCAVLGLGLRGHLVLLPGGWVDCLGATGLVPYAASRAA